MTLCRCISGSFMGNDMHKNRTVNVGSLPYQPCDALDISTVHRTEIDDSHLLKKHARDEQLLDAAFGSPDPLDHFVPVYRDLVE